MGADDLTMLLAIIQSFRQVQFSLVQSDTATKAAPGDILQDQESYRTLRIDRVMHRRKKIRPRDRGTDKYADDRCLVAPNESANASFGFAKLSSG